MNTLTELNAIERAACRQAVERAKELDDLRAELAALKAQRDILRDAIDRIRLRDPGPDGPSGDYAMCKLIAIDAFNAIARAEGRPQ